MKKILGIVLSIAAGGIVPIICLWLGAPLDIWGLDYEFGVAWIFLSLGLGVITYTVANNASRKVYVKSIGMIGAFVIGSLLLYPLGHLFSLYQLPIFNTWALSHGTFVIALPLLVLIAVKVMSAILRRMETK
jgi:Na+/phosphate symporter